MYAFHYLRPKSLEQALSWLTEYPEAKILAGGQTLIPTLKTRLARPSHLIDLGFIAKGESLLSIEHTKTEEEDMLVLGAMCTHHAVHESSLVKKYLPAVSRLAGLIGDMQVRNSGTIGGSLANNDPAADYPAAILGLGASIVTNSRRISAEDWFQGLFTTALQPGEIIRSIQFPISSSAVSSKGKSSSQVVDGANAYASGYAKFHHPSSGYAMAGVFIHKSDRGVRVAVTGAGAGGVFRWTSAEQSLVADFSLGAFDSIRIPVDQCLGDFHASSEYRAHLVGEMAKKALGAILAR